MNHASLNPTFPQQTTADQFFDESQFESYRRLGNFIAEACLDEHGRTGALVPPPQIMDSVDPPALSSRWIATLLGRKTPREGCGVDMVVVLSASIFALAIARRSWNGSWSRAGVPFCFSAAVCKDSLVKLFPRDSSLQTIASASLDSLFVALCTGVFTMACVIALQASRSSSATAMPRRGRGSASTPMAWMAFVSVALAALLAFGEDFQRSWLDADPKQPGVDRRSRLGRRNILGDDRLLDPRRLAVTLDLA